MRWLLRTGEGSRQEGRGYKFQNFFMELNNKEVLVVLALSAKNIPPPSIQIFRSPSISFSTGSSKLLHRGRFSLLRRGVVVRDFLLRNFKK
ncbi:hypothetical protein P8452_27730 [Trifolium repens]|jgi:hypothetical protein|nr:hypothetical protein P8452_27730 [Trifolium repens]